eukprot:gene14291-biopygen2059
MSCTFPAFLFFGPACRGAPKCSPTDPTCGERGRWMLVNTTAQAWLPDWFEANICERGAILYTTDPTPGTVGDPGAQPDSDSDPCKSAEAQPGPRSTPFFRAQPQPDSDSARAPAAGTQPDPVGLAQPRV